MACSCGRRGSVPGKASEFYDGVEPVFAGQTDVLCPQVGILIQRHIDCILLCQLHRLPVQLCTSLGIHCGHGLVQHGLDLRVHILGIIQIAETLLGEHHVIAGSIRLKTGADNSDVIGTVEYAVIERGSLQRLDTRALSTRFPRQLLRFVSFR